MERIWAEVNPRINYPVKAILVELMDSGDIDIDNSLQLFCISWITIRVLSVGVGSPGTITLFQVYAALRGSFFGIIFGLTCSCKLSQELAH